jgi:uncharacterized SAM-binding protein YcdF (DUF218 family)
VLTVAAAAERASVAGARGLWPFARPLALVAALAMLGAGTWFARAPLLRGAAELWIVSDRVDAADAVVILGGGVETRPFAAAAYYRAGLVKTVLLSNVSPNRVEALGIAPSHVELNRSVLLKLGVPPAAIEILGTTVSNTYEEAAALRGWAEHRHPRAVIVPSELFSSRRVRWVVQHALADTATQVFVPALDAPEYDRGNWWTHEQGVIAFQNEVIKYAYYRLKYRAAMGGGHP